MCAIPPLPDVDTSMILASQINEMKSPGYVSTDISDRRAMISLSAHKRHVEKSRSQARGVDLVQLEQPSYTKRVSRMLKKTAFQQYRAEMAAMQKQHQQNLSQTIDLPKTKRIRVVLKPPSRVS